MCVLVSEYYADLARLLTRPVMSQSCALQIAATICSLGTSLPSGCARSPECIAYCYCRQHEGATSQRCSETFLQAA